VISEAPSGPDEPVVHCRGVTKAYGEGVARVWALRGIDLDVYYGELLLLVGPSGCGKTTFLSVISAMLSPDGGSCEVLGRDLAGLSGAEKVRFRRRSIGFVFQAFNLMPALSLAENVAVPLLINGLQRRSAMAEAGRLLDAVGLSSRADDLPGQLSGGQQQRVAIARALVHRPSLVVCDEPTSNLDHRAGHEMMAMLRAVARDADRAVIIVTHDNRILELSDRVARMDDGLIVGIGTHASDYRP